MKLGLELDLKRAFFWGLFNKVFFYLFWAVRFSGLFLSLIVILGWGYIRNGRGKFGNTKNGH